MLITDIANKTIIESGQFNIGTLSDLDLSLDRFWILVKGVLAEYNKSISKEARVQVHSTEYNFTAPFPLYVSSIVPNIAPALGQDFTAPHKPVVIPWEYDGSTGHLAIGHVVGGYEAIAHYAFPFTVIKDINGNITQVDVPDLAEDDIHFFTLLQGKFLLAIGRSRRAFTLTEIPIDSDSSELVTEGIALIEEARAFIDDQSDWAYGSMM